MADPFSKFTERARRVLTYAEEEARRFPHNYIGTEHLLLGLVRVEDGVAVKMLANMGVAPRDVRSAVEYLVGPSREPAPGALPYTPRTKRVLELAKDEAKRFKCHYIGTEHQLLGLLREGEGVAAKVLAGLGVTLARAREEMQRAFTQEMEGDRELRRYTLVLPESLFREVQELADRDHTAMVEVLRRFIKLGLLATRIQETPGSALIIREGDKERQILLL